MRNNPLRIVVAEDSPTARRLLVEILRADPALTVVGEAKDGVEAVELVQRVRPDLVTMDIQMPRMDGLDATRRIMTEVPTPVVVVSTLVERDIQTSMAALRAGALAVLQKPVGPESPDFDAESRRLRDTLKAMAEVKVVRRWPERAAPLPPPVAPAPAVASQRPAVVALAASTGGPAALHRVLSELPASFPVPLLVVQHIALGFSQGFATWLGTAGPLPVKVAEDGETLLPGHVYLAPDDRHLGLHGEGRVEVSRAAPVNGFRPSATWLFRAVARVHGPRSLAVVLTGMGQDGLEGVRELRAAGGYVLAQDEPSSVVYGMPGVVVGAGLAHEVVPLPSIASRLLQGVRAGAGS